MKVYTVKPRWFIHCRLLILVIKFIVAINKIESFKIAKHELPISRMYSHEVGKLLNA